MDLQENVDCAADIASGKISAAFEDQSGDAAEPASKSKWSRRRLGAVLGLVVVLGIGTASWKTVLFGAPIVVHLPAPNPSPEPQLLESQLPEPKAPSSGSTRGETEALPINLTVEPPEAAAPVPPTRHPKLTVATPTEVVTAASELVLRGRVSDAGQTTSVEVLAGHARLPAPLDSEGCFTCRIVLEQDEVVHGHVVLPDSNERVAFTVERDSTPPELQVVAPAQGQLVRTSSIQVRVRANEVLAHATVAGLEMLSSDGKNWVAADVPVDFDGESEFEIVGTDRVGNPSRATAKVVRDATAPELVVCSPVADSVVRAGASSPVKLQFDEPLASLVVGGRKVPVKGAEGAFSASAPTLGDTWSLPWIATDVAGNVSRGNVEYALDHPTVCADVEPNDSEPAATIVAVGCSLTGQTGAGADAGDWYKFKVTTAGDVTVTLRNSSPGGRSTDGRDLDRLSVRRQGGGQWQGKASRIEPSTQDSVTFSAASGEWYFVRVAPRPPQKGQPHAPKYDISVL